MAEWKEKGYVPDSDEEEDLDFTDTVLKRSEVGVSALKSSPHPQEKSDTSTEQFKDSAVGVIKNGLSQLGSSSVAQFSRNSQGCHSFEEILPTTAELLQSTINRGLAVVHGVLSSQPVSVQIESDSRESSLSPPPSSLADELISLPSRSPKNAEPEKTIVPVVSEFTAHQRTLRDRKAIQQHPYSLEDAKYRQAWKERGLRPVHHHWNATPTIPQTTEDSQDTDLSYDTQVQQSAEHLSQAKEVDGEESQSPTSLKKRTWNTFDSVDDGDDELPDLARLLHDKIPDFGSKLKKSQNKKLVKAKKPEMQQLKTFDFDFSSSDNENDTDALAVAKVPRDSIPSPPHSDSLFSSELIMPLSHDLPFQTPGALPTPLVSSETRPSKRNMAETSADVSSASISDDEEQLVTSSQSEAEQEVPRQVERIQRRIKGVLPASWLKLDIEEQIHKIRKKNVIRAAPVTAPEKGVARRVHGYWRATNKTPQKALFLELTNSDEEDDGVSSTEVAENVHPRAIDLTRHPGKIINEARNLQVDEVVEEDFVDAMLPSRSRDRRHSEVGDDHQRRSGVKHLTQGLRDSRRIDVGSDSKRDASRKLTAAKASNNNLVNSRKRTKRNHHPIKKTILDAPDLQSQQRSSQPAYLRVAARSARQSAQRSIQAETIRKSQALSMDRYVELVQRPEEVHERDASYRPAFTAASHPSRALKPKHSLQPKIHKDLQTHSFSHTTELDKLKRSTHSLLQRVNQALPTVVAANSPLPNDQNVLRLSRLRALLPLRNRSGAGHFESRISDPRPAQLEEPAPLRIASSTVRRVPKRLVQSKLTDSRPSSARIVRPEPIKPRRNRKQALPKKMEASPRLVNLVFDNKDYRYARFRGRSTLETEGDIVARSVIEFAYHPDTTYMAPPEKINGGLISRGVLKDLDENFQKINAGGQHPTCTRTLVQDVMLKIPGHHVRQSCGRWNDKVKRTIEAIFEDIKSFSCQSTADELAIRERTTVLEDVIDYIEKNVVFVNPGELQEFISMVTEAHCELARSVNTLLASSDSSYTRVLVLRILNRMVALGVQACFLNVSLGANQNQALQPAVESLMLVTCRLAVSERCIVDLLKRDESSLGRDVDALKYPQAESIVLLTKISEIWSGQGNLGFFWNLVTTTLDLLQASTAYVRLAQLLAMVWMIASLIDIDCIGHNITAGLPRDHYPAFRLILDSLKAFVHENEKEIPENRIMLDLMMEVFSTCHFLFSCRCWDLPAALLEFWFQQFEAPWFKGNVWRTRGLLADPQQIFRDFIEACEDYFDGVDYSPNSQAGRTARALVYKLIPNRGEIGASGQVGDKFETLPPNEVQPIQNLFDLHSMLQTSTPSGIAPRLQPLAAKVNFTTAHDAICRISLYTWHQIAQSAKENYPMLQDLSTWMYGMILQTVERFHSADSDGLMAMENVRQRLEKMTDCPHHDEDVIEVERTTREIMQYNEESASDLLITVLESFHEVIKGYKDELSARTLLGSSEIKLLFKVAMSQSEFPTRVANAVLKILPTYLDLVNLHHVQSPIVSDLLNGVKHLLHDRLGCSEKCSPSLVFHLLRTWYSLAKSMVLSGYKSWDNFLVPQSSDALDMIVSNENLIDAKTLFFADFVRDHHQLYKLEWRPTILAHWVASLLRHPESLVFDHQFTAQIFNAEQDTTLFSDTVRELKIEEDIVFSRQDILDHRTSIIRNLIRSIYCQSFSPVDYFGVKEVMNRSHGIRILRSIIESMRENWPLVREDSVSAAEYRQLVIHVVEELKLYPVSDLRYDISWFVTSSGFPCFQPQNYSELLTKSFQTESVIENGSGSSLDLRSLFRQTLLAAERGGSLENFSMEMKQIFLPTAREVARVSNGKQSYSIELAEQARFIEAVFPAYIEQASTTLQNQRMGNTVAEILEHVLGRIHLRIDGLSIDTIRPLLLATHPVLAAIRKALETRAKVSGIVLKLAGTIFDRLYVFGEVSEEIIAVVSAIVTQAPSNGSDDDTMNSITLQEGRQWLCDCITSKSK